MVNIAGLNKARVLQAIYNCTPGYYRHDSALMSLAAATRAIHDTPDLNFNYWLDRVVNVDLSGDDINPTDYDTIYGKDALADIIALLRDDPETAEAA